MAIHWIKYAKIFGRIRQENPYFVYVLMILVEIFPVKVTKVTHSIHSKTNKTSQPMTLKEFLRINFRMELFTQSCG